MLIKKLEQIDVKYFKDLKMFIEYSNVYPNIDGYNPNKKTQNTDCISHDSR